MPSTSDISVVVPVKARPSELERAIRALLRQTLLPMEIVVVDQTADDSCAEASRRAFAGSPEGPTVLVYRHETALSGLTAARNYGLSVAKAGIIVYCDDDAELDVDGLHEFSRTLAEHPEVIAAGGVITNYSPPALLSRVHTRLFHLGPFFDERQPVYWNWDQLPISKLIPTTKLNGGMMAFRREVLEETGGFDERLRGSCVAEDIEITQRILKLTDRADSVVLVPSVHITHESLGEWKNADRTVEFQLVSQHYLLYKNLRSPLNHLRYWWMAFGLLLRSLLSSLKRREIHPIRSYCAGIKCIFTGYAHCPFLVPSQHAASSVVIQILTMFLLCIY